MVRYSLLSLCLIFCIFLPACEQGGTAPQQKIGVVNLNRIMVDSDAGRAAAKYMENMQNSMRTRLTELQGRAEGEKADNDVLQKEVQQAYAKMQSEQQNVQSILNDVLHRTVDAYRRANGYDIILFSDVVLSFDDGVDVTSGITAAMNKEKVEFKPLPEPKPEVQTQGSQTPAPEKKPDATEKTDGPSEKSEAAATDQEKN